MQGIRFRALLIALSVGLTGCLRAPPQPVEATPARACERLLLRVDELIAEAEVSDRFSTAIEGFPYLRLSRFWAAFADDQLAGTSYEFWLENLRTLDAEARRTELLNLPDAQRRILQSYFSAGAKLEPILEGCAQRLLKRDQGRPETRKRLLTVAKIPAAYVTWHRALGLYPMVKWPFYWQVVKLHRELSLSFRQPPSQIPVTGQLLRYSPAEAESLTRTQVGAIIHAASQNPLAIPQPGPEDLERLFDTYAPIWEIDTLDDNDRIGRIALDRASLAHVDATKPTVYRLVSHTRFEQHNLLQLVYLIWFPARAAEGMLDIYAGAFDGLIWRVTLSERGDPIAYDSIHPCGCYYHLFPGKGFRYKPIQDGSEPVFSPKTLEHLASGERLAIRLSARKHFIQQVYPVRQQGPAITYQTRAYNALRALEIPGQTRHASFFDACGFTPGSERAERFLFWPMGVRNAGAMRQWGNHAIAFVGTRHFDDPTLLQGLLDFGN